MEFLFTIESLGLSFMEIRLGANGIGGSEEVIKKMVEEKSISSSDDEVTMKKIAFQRRNSSFSEDPSEEVSSLV